MTAVKGVRSCGLVSVPTTQKPASMPAQTAQEVDALRVGTRSFVPPFRQARIARMRRSVGFAARMQGADRPGFRHDSVVMVTATYRDGVEWEPNHVRTLLDHVRKWCKRRGIECRYVWVGEVQTTRRKWQGGHCLHYHVALWIPFGHMLPKADAQGWWPHGSTRTELARKAVPYLMKYFSKGNTLTGAALPHGARCHGRGGLGEAWRAVVRWLSLPAFIQARASVADRWHRVRGGGWADADGALWPSEWARVWAGDGYALKRVAAHGRPCEADGPVSGRRVAA